VADAGWRELGRGVARYIVPSQWADAGERPCGPAGATGLAGLGAGLSEPGRLAVPRGRPRHGPRVRPSQARPDSHHDVPCMGQAENAGLWAGQRASGFMAKYSRSGQSIWLCALPQKKMAVCTTCLHSAMHDASCFMCITAGLCNASMVENV
jgi:hypothetical protein